MVVSTTRKILIGSTDRGGDRAAPLYTHALYRYTADTFVSYHTYVLYEITQRTGVLVCICQSVYQCMYLRTTLCMYVYACAYACVCMIATRHHVPLPSSPLPFLPTFPLYTHRCIIQKDTYITPHVYCLLHEASPTPCSVLRNCCTLCICRCQSLYNHAEHLYFCRPKILRAREKCFCIYWRMARWEFV